MVARGVPSDKVVDARRSVQPLSEEYNTLLYSWVREQQVASLHAWACALGIDLTLTAFPGSDEYLQATQPLSAQLVLGSDLDPASTEDFRKVVAKALSPDGFVIAGIQQTEVKQEAEAEEDGSAAATPSATRGAGGGAGVAHDGHGHRHGAHDHSGVKGNAYNFASSPQHATSFDLLQGQLGSLQCFRTSSDQPLGCVEGAYNWFASLCELGEHTGQSAALGGAT